MKNTCIAWPPDEPLLVIRKSQLDICNGNHCAAALLSFFEYWHNHKIAHRTQAEHANRVARQYGTEGTQDTSLLQFHNEKELEAGLLDLYERKRIRKAIDFLVQQGFLSIHKNPNARYSFDQTRYFLFHPEVVSSQLIDITDQTKIPDRVANEPCRCEDDLNSKSSQVVDILDEDFCPDPSNQKGASSGQKGGTRTEITPEITDRVETQDPPLAPQGAERVGEQATRKPKEEYSLGFERFWSIYPLKKQKDTAYKAWLKKSCESIAATIIASVEQHMAGDRKWQSGYTPYPSTFLNGGGWKDEIETAQAYETPPVSHRANHIDKNAARTQTHLANMEVAIERTLQREHERSRTVLPSPRLPGGDVQ